MADICQFVCAYRTPSGYCGSTGGYATCPHRKMDEPPTIKSAEPMTNADKYFRHATDEEIAKYMSHGKAGCHYSQCKNNISCYECWLDWLKQEGLE